MDNLLRYIPTTADLIINIKDYESFIQVAKLEERERIIKLLEDIISERLLMEQTVDVMNEISNLRYLIELIKGEQK